SLLPSSIIEAAGSPIVETTETAEYQSATNVIQHLPKQNPFLKAVTNQLGEILLSYEYISGTNNPIAPPKIEINAEGATARGARHSIEFSGNLNRNDAIIIGMPDNRILKGHPVALSISDDLNHRIWLGQLKDCQGSILPGPGNQV